MLACSILPLTYAVYQTTAEIHTAVHFKICIIILELRYYIVFILYSYMETLFSVFLSWVHDGFIWFPGELDNL